MNDEMLSAMNDETNIGGQRTSPPTYVAKMHGWILKQYFQMPIPSEEIVILHDNEPEDRVAEYVEVEIIPVVSESPTNLSSLGTPTADLF